MHVREDVGDDTPVGSACHRAWTQEQAQPALFEVRYAATRQVEDWLDETGATLLLEQLTSWPAA